MRNSYDPSTNDTNNAFPINQKPRFTHHFIYRTKEFNIDPILISRNSNYFNRNLDKFALCNAIYFEGNDDDPDLSDFIQTFFDICHFNQVLYTEENAIPLYYLSYIYDAQKIKKETEQYIKEHYDHLASKLFQFKINNDKSLFKREIISKNLVYHINHNSTELKSFPIYIIYDIISLYFHHNYKKEEEELIINFLFDCLNFYGREASVLFTFVDFRKENMKFIQKLTEEFNSVFDFTYINESICKLLSDQNKEISKISPIQTSNEIKEKDKTIKNLREMNEFYLNEISRLKLENDQFKSNNNQTMIESEKEKTVIYIDDNFVYYKLFEKQKISEVIESPKANGDVVIPASITFGQNEYKITRIGANAFKKSEIRTLSFSEKSNLESIGHFAFEDSSIQKISFPSSLRSLDLGWCFDTFCLNEVEVDPQNPYFYVENGILMYKNERKYEICFVPRNFRGEFIIKENITRIGDYSFASSYDLLSVNTLSQTLLIDEGAFLNCNHLKNFNFRFKELKQESKIIIGKICFKGCNSLVSFKIPPTMFVELGLSAFIDCKKIKNISVEAVSKLVISNQCFFNDNNLSSIKITGDEVLIGNQSFSNCTSITSLSLTNSSRIKICQEAFKGCKWLKKVLLSEQTSNLSNKSIVIGSRCFSNCSSLNEFKIEQATDLTLMDFVFENCSKFKKINFCSKVMNIGDECFVGSKINSITLEGEEIIIGNNCFKDCISISSFSIPQTIDVEVGSSCFEGCKNIKQVFIEAVSNIKIRDRCFYNINKLSLIGITCNKLIIGKQCFYNCLSLTSLSLSNINLIFLDENAFERCKNLETVSILARTELAFGNFYFKGNKLKTSDLSDRNIVIGNNCFMDCSSLSEFKIENISDLKLMKSVFLNCEKLESISFNSKMMNIGDECFVGSKINNISLEGDEIKIGNKCFKGCQSLTSFSIPSSIDVQFGISCFEDCQTIDEVSIQSSSKIEIQERCFYSNINLKSIQIHCDKLIVCKHGFYNCCSLKSLVLSNISLTTLNENAFERCKGIETISIIYQPKEDFSTSSCFSDSNVVIGSNCFIECISLAEIRIEYVSHLTIMKDAFNKCRKLESIALGSKMMNIRDECFIESTIKNVTFEGEEIIIGDNCFKNCQSIITLSIPSSIKVEIGSSCFENCPNIEYVRIESSTKIELKDRSFFNNNKMKKIELWSNEINIGSHCFYNCNSITTINFQEMERIILQTNSFENCQELEAITISAKSEIQAGQSCFDKATKLKSIYLGSKKVVINSFCFANCSSLSSFIVSSAEEVTLGQQAFDICKNLETVDVFARSKFKASCFCFNMAYKIKRITINSRNILIGSRCFNYCSLLSQINCPIAKNIKFFENSFNGLHFSECLKHPDEAKLDSFKSNLNYNHNECKIV